MTPEEHFALDHHPTGGIVGYVQRMREGHGPTFVPHRHNPSELIYSGCRCGAVACNAPYWLAHIDDCLAAYNGKVADLAAETARTTALTAALDAKAGSRDG